MYFILCEADKNKVLKKYVDLWDKEVLEKNAEIWDKIKSLIKKISDKPGKYEKDFMKMKFNSDDNLPLNKILKLHNLTIIVRSGLEKDNKFYPQIFIDECFYGLERCYTV